MILIVLLESILFVAILAWFFYIWEHLMMRKPDRAIYHASNLKEQGPHLRKIVNKYLGGQESNYSFVELGAGLAKVSHYMSIYYRWKSVEAVELGSFILRLAKIRQKIFKSPIRFHQENFFSYQSPPPSVIYCYLFTELMNKLYHQHKFDGHLVISLTFPIPKVVPTEEVSLKSWQRVLYVYDFRNSIPLRTKARSSI